MKQNNLFKWSSLLLLIINLLLIGFIVFAPPPHPEGPKKHIINQLKLDDEQIVQYETLIETHQQRTQEIHEQIKAHKKNLYTSLSKKNTEDIDTLSKKIGDLHQQIEQQNFEHFSALKKICHAEQLKAFDQLAKELAELFDRKPKPPHKKKH